MVVVPMQVHSGSEEGEEGRASSSCGGTGNACGPHTRASELTISFEGEVYVFPAVTPQKVPFLLLLFLICIDFWWFFLLLLF